MLSLDRLIKVEELEKMEDIEALRRIAIWYRLAFGDILPRHHILKDKVKSKNKKITTLLSQIKHLKQTNHATTATKEHRISNKARAMIIKEKQGMKK